MAKGESSIGPTELPPQFGRYRVIKKLGGGGMGSVYLVENIELEREEALKVPHFGDGAATELRERFLREARSAAKLDHANLCPVYDAGVLDGIYYLTMRYLKGRLLSDYTGRPQPARKSVEIATKLSQALEAAHSKGVIHRDLKPSNIMMVAGVGPVVMDFGLAKQVQQVDSKLTQAGAMLGTPAYMPPEQVNGELEQMGPASDVYSLGVLLYELLAGRLPFDGTMASIFGKILYVEAQAPSAVVPGLNAELDGICRKAMAKAPADRYPSMKAFAAVLMEYLRSTPASQGAGTLVPVASDQGSVFQAATVPPAPQPAGGADIFQAATLVPQSRSALPLPPSGAAAIRTSDDSSQTGPAGEDPANVEDEPTPEASVGTNLVRMFVLMLVLGAVGSVGMLIYTVTKTPEPKPKPEQVADATPPKTEKLPVEKTKKPRIQPQPKAGPGKPQIVATNTSSRQPAFPKTDGPRPVTKKPAQSKSAFGRRTPKSVDRFPKDVRTAPETVLVPEKVTQPAPTVHDKYQVATVSCLQQNDGLICTLLITDLLGDRVVRTVNIGNANAVFALGKEVHQASMKIGSKKGYDLLRGVKLFKDVPLEITIVFKGVPLNSPQIVLLDLGFQTPKIELRGLKIQQVVDPETAASLAAESSAKPTEARPESPAPKPIDPKPAEPKAAKASVDDFVPLFNGKDLTGWHVDGGQPGTWGVEPGGVLVARGQNARTRNYLLTDGEYSDFIVRLEFNLDKGAGSGLAVRALPGEQLPAPNGKPAFDHPMLKLIETATPGQEQTGSTYWVAGGMYVKPDQSAKMQPARSWNRLMVEVKGHTLRAEVNGKPVLNTTLAPGARLPDGLVPALYRVKGRIGLQKHTLTVRFRNIELKDLADTRRKASGG